ncbi:hypothetical protein BDQ12DRAFT_585404, partial [Crucibulum laeve]
STVSPMTGFIVRNLSGINGLQVFVSMYSNEHGSDAWYSIAPNSTENWGRNGWELIAFQEPGTQNRRGWYL